MTVDRDLFVSFTGADRPWAEWLVAELDAAGYSGVSQLRDFVAGTNFALAMDAAARRARRTLGVLSPKALEARFVRQEWAQRLAADPTGEQRALVLVRVQPCQPEGLLGPVVYIDLVGLDEVSARARAARGADRGGPRPAAGPHQHALSRRDGASNGGGGAVAVPDRPATGLEPPVPAQP